MMSEPMALRRSSLLLVSGFLAVASLLGGGPAARAAEPPALNPDRPEVYVVQPGDTLWDISARFLRDPWMWPEIWDANPDIENPHLIYPGDRLMLVFEAGRPRLRRVGRTGPRPTVKLSPRVRVLEREDAGAIPAIPIDAVAAFLARPRVVGEETLRKAPYIVSVGKEHLIAGTDFRVYARGPGLEPAGQFSVYRSGTTYRDPDTGEILGYEAIHLGDAEVTRGGDPATLRLVGARREILRGDRLLPVADDAFDQSFQPHPPDSAVQGSIIDVSEGVTQIGQFQVVVLDLGRRDGIEPGHVLAVYQRGALVEDEYAEEAREELPEPEPWIETDPEKQKGLDGLSVAVDQVLRDIQRRLTPEGPVLVRLPDERAGAVMVFRTFERISYALVMDATRPMHVLDVVRTP